MSHLIKFMNYTMEKYTLMPFRLLDHQRVWKWMQIWERVCVCVYVVQVQWMRPRWLLLIIVILFAKRAERDTHSI